MPGTRTDPREHRNRPRCKCVRLSVSDRRCPRPPPRHRPGCKCVRGCCTACGTCSQPGCFPRGANVCATIRSITSSRARSGCFPRSANVCAGCRPACQHPRRERRIINVPGRRSHDARQVTDSAICSPLTCVTAHGNISSWARFGAATICSSAGKPTTRPGTSMFTVMAGSSSSGTWITGYS